MSAGLRSLGVWLLAAALLGSGCARAPASTHEPAPPSSSPVAAEPSAPPVLAQPASLPASAASAPRYLDTLSVAYNALLDKYFRPLPPEPLARAALDGLRAEARRQAIDAGALEGVVVPEGRAPALASLSAAYRSLLESAPTADAQQLALASVRAMARSAQENHTYLVPKREDSRSSPIPRFDVVDRLSQGVYWLESSPSAVVREVAEGSPAAGAGLKPGDRVVRVGGRDVSQVGGAAVRASLSAREGPLRLGVQRPGVGYLDLDVQRSFSRGVPVLEARVLAERVGYLHLHSFPAAFRRLDNGRTIDEELGEDLSRFEAKGASAWVLDLRGNGGGSVDTLSTILGRFLADGVVLGRVNRAGQRGEILVDGHPFQVQRPLAVLVDSGSASASEILAADVQEEGRGLVLGQRTRGSVNVTAATELPGGAVLYITVAQALTGKDGRALDGSGAAPDQVVADNPGDLAAGKDAVLERAVAALLPRAKEPPSRPEGGVPTTLPLEELTARLKPYLAIPADFAEEPGLQLYGWRAYNSLNRYVAGAPDARALRARAAGRGWLGSLTQYFGPGGDAMRFYYWVSLYTDAEAASRDFLRHDFPSETEDVASNLAVGEERQMRQGTGANSGVVGITWRRGRALYGLSYIPVGFGADISALRSAATRIDARLAEQPNP